MRGLLAALADIPGSHRVTVVANTGDDLTLWGLRVCPDLDTLTYTLGGGIAEDQGWGRAAESHVVRDELAAYAVLPTWFGLGDRDLATHLTRTALLAQGASLSEATAVIARRWGLAERGVRLLPMSDDPVETHLRIVDGEGERTVHFQEYWVRLRAVPEVREVLAVGAADARPAPGVLEAIRDADAVLLPPSNPVVSVGTVLAVPGVRAALEATSAPVVGIAPLIGGSVVRGMADRLLPVLGVPVDAGAVARHYGAALLDGWLVDEVDASLVPAVVAAGIPCRAVPLLMRDVPATAAMARAALDLAGVS